MAKPNYEFARRQKDIAKKKKQEEKRLKKLNNQAENHRDESQSSGTDPQQPA